MNGVKWFVNYVYYVWNHITATLTSFMEQQHSSTNALIHSIVEMNEIIILLNENIVS